MRRRVDDPRQAELATEPPLPIDDRQLALALAAGLTHIGLAAALAAVVAATGRASPGLQCGARVVFLAHALAIDAATQAISVRIGERREARARVSWENVALTSIEHERRATVPCVVYAGATPLYLFRDPAPVLLCDGAIEPSDPDNVRATLLGALQHGLITREQPHPR